MAGTKQSAEAMGFVLSFSLFPLEKRKPLKNGSLKINRNESVGERSVLGEALTEVLVDGTEVRMSA
jgi:hypothetical protein